MSLSLLLRLESPVASSSSAETPLAYDPQLTATLEADRGALLELLQRVRELAKQRYYAPIAPVLREFQERLQGHLFRKNAQCLPYLERHIRDEQARLAVRRLRHEAPLTERAVSGFLRHYLSYPVSDLNVQRFGRELDQVTAELRGRLEQERRTLHGLYLPAPHYA